MLLISSGTLCCFHDVNSALAVNFSVTQLIDDGNRIAQLEFITTGPGGDFGSDLFLSSLGTGFAADGAVYTLSLNGNVTPFLTGIDATHVVFDTIGILGGGMFVTDFNQQNSGFADGPGKIWHITPATNVPQLPNAPILAEPDKFKIELYEDFSRFETGLQSGSVEIPPGSGQFYDSLYLPFYLTISNGESGFPSGLLVTSGPLPGFTEIPPDSGNIIPSSNRLFYLDSPFSAITIADGFNSIETSIFAQGDYGEGLLITEPRENRIQRLRLIIDPISNQLVPEITTFATFPESSPFGPTGLTYADDPGPDNIFGTNDDTEALFVTDGSPGRLLKVNPDGSSLFIADIPFPPNAISFKAAKPIAPDKGFCSTQGGIIAGTFSSGFPNATPGDTVFAVCRIVPEPTSTLSLLALGTLGAASTLKRQLKSCKTSEKETTKVG